ncbi:DMT family transporter [Pedobacter sp. R-06]|uniref:DMT family transporter n=1 Tax=Pedobacter sp. R-06 TaxID=3404051 RepID=UPI003CF8DC64
MVNSKIITYISLVLVMLIWGSSFTVTKLVVKDVGPIQFAFTRHLIASVVLLPFFFRSFSKQSYPSLTKRDYLIITLMGIIGIGLYYPVFNLSLQHTSASSGALIQGTMPMMIAFMGTLFLKERISKMQMVGFAIAFAGIVLVALKGHQSGNKDGSMLGNFLMLGSVILWSAYTVLSRKLDRLNPITLTALSTFIGTGVLFLFSFFEDRKLFSGIPMKHWWGILYMGVAGSAVCYLLYNYALKKLPAAKVGNFLNLDPIIGAAIAVVFLSEPLSFWMLLAGVLVLTGLLITNN